MVFSLFFTYFFLQRRQCLKGIVLQDFCKMFFKICGCTITIWDTQTEFRKNIAYLMEIFLTVFTSFHN